jgi:hypothetical protein
MSSRLRKRLERLLPYTEPSLPKFKKFKSLVKTPELLKIIKHYVEFIHDLEIDNDDILKEIYDFTKIFCDKFHSSLMSLGTMTLVQSLDKALANAVPPNHYGITYV